MVANVRTGYAARPRPNTIQSIESISTGSGDVTTTHTTVGLYVGGTGNVKVDTANGDTVTIVALAAGVWHPISVTKIYATGTTATDILVGY